MAAALVAAAAVGIVALSGLGGSSDVLFEPDFKGPNRLLTNEYAQIGRASCRERV